MQFSRWPVLPPLSLAPNPEIRYRLFSEADVGQGTGFDVTPKTISITRAPVLTLWAAVVAQRLGFDEEEALTLGKALAGLNAQAKGRRLGIFKPHEEKAKKVR